MKKRTLLQECLLSASVVAIPGLCLAADSSPLQPVKTGSALKALPDVDSHETAIQQSRFQEQYSGVSQAAAERQRPVITLIQHDTSSNKNGNGGETKKPGFLKRFFGRFSSSSDEENSQGAAGQATAGEPARSIPKPPPIDFTMPGQTQNAQGSVPAQTIGFDGGTPPTYRPAQSSSSKSLAKHDDQLHRQQSADLPVRSSPRQDDFVSPFESEETAEHDALLDLDSLIQGRQPVGTSPRNARDTVQQSDEILVPELDLSTANREPVRVIPARKERVAETKAAAPSGPFTGYRLPSDDEVLGLPEPKSQSATPQPLPEVAVTRPTISEPTEVVKIPLLEEPAMALPPVAVEPPQFEEPVEALSKPMLIDPVEPQQAEVFRTTESQAPVMVPPRFVETPSDSAATLKAMDGRAQREQQRYRIMARTGKVGFKGFCPVALRNDRDLIDSREQFKAKFGLQTYYFSSHEAKSEFEANPARYAPAGGGNDVVLLVNTGEEAPGSLDFSLWYRDRLYMFRSRETQAMFSKDPKRYADQY